MYRSKLLTLFSIFCLLNSFRAQDAGDNSMMDMMNSDGSMMDMMNSDGTMMDMGSDGSMDMETGSDNGMTSQTPPELLSTFAVDIHFLAGHPEIQSIAYHYCSTLSPGFTQCDVFNGTDNTSRLMGSELIVSADIFNTLDMDERTLWHSHAFAIQNGLFVIPGLPADQEQATYMALASTYGKVVDFWHSNQDFPLGAPQLAYGLGALSQINQTVADELDAALNLSTTWEERQAARVNWTLPAVIEGANDYLTSGVYPQYVIQRFNVSNPQ